DDGLVLEDDDDGLILEDDDGLVLEDDTSTPAPSGGGESSAGGGGGLDFMGGGQRPRRQVRQQSAAEIEAAKRADIERIWVMQRRPFLKTGRVELYPEFSSNTNDPLISLYQVGGGLRYHLDEVMSLGFRGGYTIGDESSNFEKVIEDYQVFPQVSRPNWYATATFTYVPIYGKFSLFGTWIVPWELQANAGLGWIRTFLDGHYTASIGVAQRLFLSRWLTMHFGIEDQIYQESYQPEPRILNQLMVTAGLSIFFPMDFEYQELR
ncbi:MAG: outer membrane beta-barrel domain-containing protein, partial [Myxococcota bacterium]|nr:outer membrane beta-barrel domain-containing protein [Myxococcota bacterium]